MSLEATTPEKSPKPAAQENMWKCSITDPFQPFWVAYSIASRCFNLPLI